jgi:Putative Actinobacterial Holin-X, holin superfamily III
MSTVRPHRDQSIVQLVTKLAKDVQALVRLEIELAKAELTAQVKAGAAGGAMFAAAGVLIGLAVLMLSVAAAFAIALVLPTWAGFAIVAGAYILIAIVLALIGRSRLRKLQGLKRTTASVQDAKDVLNSHLQLEGEARDEGLSVPDLMAKRAAEAGRAAERDADRAAARQSAASSTQANAEQWRAEVGPDN